MVPMIPASSLYSPKRYLPIHAPFAAGGDVVAEGFEDLALFLAGFGEFNERLEKPGGTVFCCA